jgi:hypothetical protein
MLLLRPTQRNGTHTVCIRTGNETTPAKRKFASGKMIAVLAPPPHYDHPYRGPVVEMVMPLAQARALCRKQGVIADACSWTKCGKCYLVIPRGGPVKELAPYRRHEIAHCNGWSGRHGG